MNTSTSDCIEKRIELKASLSRVWRALTDYKEFGAWFRVNLEGPFVVGQTTRGKITYPGYEHLVMEVLVEKMEKERLFSYRWHPGAENPKGTPDEPTTLVEFLLEKIDDGVLLVIRESGFDALPASERDEAFRRNEGGWTEQVKNIEAHLADAQ